MVSDYGKTSWILDWGKVACLRITEEGVLDVMTKLQNSLSNTV